MVELKQLLKRGSCWGRWKKKENAKTLPGNTTSCWVRNVNNGIMRKIPPSSLASPSPCLWLSNTRFAWVASGAMRAGPVMVCHGGRWVWTWLFIISPIEWLSMPTDWGQRRLYKQTLRPQRGSFDKDLPTQTLHLLTKTVPSGEWHGGYAIHRCASEKRAVFISPLRLKHQRTGPWVQQTLMTLRITVTNYRPGRAPCYHCKQKARWQSCTCLIKNMETKPR